jgi:hypothetical protein
MTSRPFNLLDLTPRQRDLIRFRRQVGVLLNPYHPVHGSFRVKLRVIKVSDK